jgi:predicted transcriptional regulator
LRIRARDDIIADILRLLIEPKLKTHVTYGANLSHGQTQHYFKRMELLGFIQRTGGKKWVATEKGKDFLWYYQHLHTMLKEDVSPRLESP